MPFANRDLRMRIDILESSCFNFCMTEDDRRSILEAVASGTLTPEEAVDQLEGASGEDSMEPPRVSGRGGTIRLQVMTGGHIEILGDPTVQDVKIDGPGRKTELERHGDDVTYFI